MEIIIESRDKVDLLLKIVDLLREFDPDITITKSPDPPAPKKYAELELRNHTGFTWIAVKGDNMFAQIYNISYDMATAREVVRRYNLGSRAFAWMREHRKYFTVLSPIHAIRDAILDELDAGPPRN